MLQVCKYNLSLVKKQNLLGSSKIDYEQDNSCAEMDYRLYLYINE